jgi:hypothetical protein
MKKHKKTINIHKLKRNIIIQRKVKEMQEAGYRSNFINETLGEVHQLNPRTIQRIRYTPSEAFKLSEFETELKKEGLWN